MGIETFLCGPIFKLLPWNLARKTGGAFFTFFRVNCLNILTPLAPFKNNLFCGQIKFGPAVQIKQ
jgi:hypothetical protein